MSIPLAARPLAWVVRKTGGQTLLALGLLLAILESLAWVLATSLRGLEDAWLWLSAALGLLAGWLLARSRLGGWQAGPMAFLLGLAATLSQLAGLFGTLFRVISGMIGPVWALARWPYSLAVDFRPLAPLLDELWSGISVPMIRLYHWSSALLAGNPAFDPAAMSLLWNLVVWSAAAWAAWWFRRRSQPFLAILPAAGLLAALLSYQRASAYPLLAVVAATLLLSALCSYQGRRQEWESEQVDFYEDAPFEISLAAGALVLIAGAAFILAPSPSLQRLLQFSRGLPSGETGGSGKAVRSLGLEPRAVEPSPFAGIWSPGLPREHLLGSGPELSRQPVMHIRVDPANFPVSNGVQEAPRLYWRGRSYDVYTGRGWSTSGFYSQSHPAGERLFDPQGLAGFEINQEIQFYPDSLASDRSTLYTAGAPLSTNRPLRAGWRARQDLFAALLVGPASGGPAFMPESGPPAFMPSYTAQSWVTRASQEQLRAAGQDYPDWVRAKYLNLPDSLPDRVLGLGRDLTAAEPTPYDRALAIEAYLREFPYSLDLPAPPTGWDVSDYFLFEIKRGYCDYYATAMVVLARAAGLPARLVVGYASGEYDPASQAYRVTAADAHSWPEVYFPGIGWVEFEPTGGRPPLRRPESAPVPQAQPGGSPTPTPAPGLRQGFGTLLAALAGLAGLSLLILLTRSGLDAWRLQRLPPATALAVLYQRLRLAGSRIGAELSPADTPYEAAARIEAQVGKLGRDGGSSEPLLQARQGVRWLVERYAISAYSPHLPAPDEQTEGIRTWRALRVGLWLAQLRRNIRKLLG